MPLLRHKGKVVEDQSGDRGQHDVERGKPAERFVQAAVWRWLRWRGDVAQSQPDRCGPQQRSRNREGEMNPQHPLGEGELVLRQFNLAFGDDVLPAALNPLQVDLKQTNRD